MAKKISKKDQVIESFYKADKETVEPKKSIKSDAATTLDSWEPKPDMGHILPPSEGKNICECGHARDMHYGTVHFWCNTPNCRCAQWKAS